MLDQVAATSMTFFDWERIFGEPMQSITLGNGNVVHAWMVSRWNSMIVSVEFTRFHQYVEMVDYQALMAQIARENDPFRSRRSQG